MAGNLDQAIDTTLVSHELVAKFAIVEELRLLSSKIDRLTEILSRQIMLPEESAKLFESMEDLRKAYKRDLQRRKKRRGKRTTP